MKTTANRRILILSDLESPYFEQSVFILKENVGKEEEALLNEARSIVDKYIKRCERGSLLTRPKEKRVMKSVFSMAIGAAAGGTIVFLANLI